MILLILKISLLVLSIHAVLKPLFFYILKYDVRRKQLDKSYGNKASATTMFDNVILVIMILLVILLFIAKKMEYISFIAGLYIGATLIQTYFHSFTKPLPDDKAPKPPVSPIKLMSYAIQANPEKPWKQLFFISLLFLWGIYMMVTTGF
ncbi:MAG TPA: hypothetical protein VLF89_01700 [Candidatus Saccharimonadales bacterium]|nr:hypothetical protein [Candidatus Saccharimonadales bacterium]